MTDSEAELALANLAKHYRQPVMPLRRFCTAMDEWANAIRENNHRPDGEFGHYDIKSHRHGHDYVEHLGHIIIDIQKSALLFRLLYIGEKRRTVRCPEHHGELQMGEWINDASTERCGHGCGGTGWMPCSPT